MERVKHFFSSLERSGVTGTRRCVMGQQCVCVPVHAHTCRAVMDRVRIPRATLETCPSISGRSVLPPSPALPHSRGSGSAPRPAPSRCQLRLCHSRGTARAARANRPTVPRAPTAPARQPPQRSPPRAQRSLPRPPPQGGPRSPPGRWR